MDCAGPVKVVSKTQTATGDAGSYDKGRNNVILTGHVVLTDGRNVTKGERLVYDLNTGTGGGPGRRVARNGAVSPRQRRPREARQEEEMTSPLRT